MRSSIKIVFVCVILIALCLTMISPVYALSSIEEQIGEKTTQAMLNEIINAINRYSTITNQDMLNKIKNITSIYGLELNDDEVQAILDRISNDINANVTDKISFMDRVKMFIDNLAKRIEETFPSVKDKEVVVTVPRMSQVDSWVNQGIHYFIRNILPLLDA